MNRKLWPLERVTEKWTPKYPNSMKRWKDNWDAISPIFKFSVCCPEGHLHDECDRIAEFHLSEAESPEEVYFQAIQLC